MFKVVIWFDHHGKLLVFTNYIKVKKCTTCTDMQELEVTAVPHRRIMQDE